MSALSGKTTLVTGVSCGIGRASALALAKAVVVEIRAIGGRADAIAANLAALDGPLKLAARVLAVAGDRLNILVANAGVSKAATAAL
jgi:3-oxoacyl-[acyl-carrier protein] reductase